MTSLQEALGQSVAINNLFQKLIKAETEASTHGDRISYQLRANFTFRTGSNSPGQMVFNIPESFDFEGARLSLYLQSRRLNLTDSTQNDVVFTPTRWAQDFEDATTLPSTASISFQVSDSYRDSGQSAATSVVTAFSGLINQSPTSAYPGAMEFPVPYYLPKGSNFILQISPTFTTALGTADMREFQVAGVFDGWKAVR